MSGNELLQIMLALVVIVLLARPLGAYMAAVYSGQTPGAARLLRPLERWIYRLTGVRPAAETGWKRYAVAMLLMNAAGTILLYGIERLQHALPLNPQQFRGMAPLAAFNAAVSFATNTNWQSYAGEAAASYATQMIGFAVQNFLSAATGMAVLIAVVRGLVRRKASKIGNFWVDLVRGVLYILLPLSIVLAVLFVSQGVVQTFAPYHHVAVLEPADRVSGQLLPLGPAASQIAIKQLGTNGGGFYNVNAAHPFENPTPLSNFLGLIAILLIPAALCYTFGRMVGDTRQGRAIFAAMMIIFVALLAVAVHEETAGNPLLSGAAGAAAGPLSARSGGNMEGKEVRFGPAQSALWAAATTAASNGSVNSMHDSFTPIGGLVPMVLMKLGEVVFGGVGSGLYGMLAFVLVSVFVAGLMIGRTPEYLGKRIDAYEVKMASLLILIPPLLVLAGSAAAVATRAGRAGVLNPGAHGLSEILYAFASAGNNNGSAFAGLNASTPFYNVVLGIVMFFARYWLAIPALALAGSLARKKYTPPGAGTLPTTGPLFIGLLVGIVLIVGALTFLPALSLGPIVESLGLHAGGAA